MVSILDPRVVGVVNVSERSWYFNARLGPYYGHGLPHYFYAALGSGINSLLASKAGSHEGSAHRRRIPDELLKIEGHEGRADWGDAPKAILLSCAPQCRESWARYEPKY